MGRTSSDTVWNSESERETRIYSYGVYSVIATEIG